MYDVIVENVIKGFLIFGFVTFFILIGITNPSSE